MKSSNLKKIISGITAICLMSAMSLNVSAVPNPGQSLTGDVNRDNQVNYVDLLDMKKRVLSITQNQMGGGNRRSSYDLNSDGIVNVIDALILKNIILSQSSTDPEQTTTSDVTTTPSETTIPDVTTVTDVSDSDVTTVTTEVTEPPVVIQDAVKFTFNSSGVTAYDVDGNEVDSQMVNDTTVTITVPGEYTFDGECADGQIVVDVDKDTYVDGLVTLNLEGLILSNTTTSPIYVASIDDVCEISAKKDTINVISDGTSEYTNADGGVGAIYSKDDLKFKGKGKLTVYGNYEDAIVSKNDIKIWNSTLSVVAVDDGIRGKDSVKIGDSDDMVENGGNGFSNLNISITAGGDGIKSTNYEDEGKGKININGGTISITSYSDGIQAEQEININGGDIRITTTAQQSSSGSNNQPGGGRQSTTTDDTSAKGIKAALDDSSTLDITEAINITGGTININSTDDSIHSNGDINITGGTFTLSSGDDAIHADGTLTTGTTDGTLDEFTIYVSQCYEGLEASIINQNAGTVIVNSEDDGYNAAGGNDGSGNTSPGGWNQGGGFGSSSGNYSMNLNGGFVLVNAADGDHDGFDSNGSLTISGGYFISNGNDTFDADGTMSFNGGVYVKDYNSEMSGTSWTQTVSASGSVSAGERITIADESGNVIVSFLAGKSISNVVAGCTGYSSAVVYTGGTITGTALTGTGDQECYVSGTISGGTQLNNSGSTGGGQTNPWGN